MKTLMALICCGIACAALAQQPGQGDQRKAILLEGLGPIHHPVSTKNADAQKFFDQGLRLVYAFNHDEAHRAFQMAAELDPKLAMAHWGLALTKGSNYNFDAPVDYLKLAYGHIQKAVELAGNAPAHEQAYVAALAKRYGADPAKADKKKLAADYKQAMGELSKKYPDDLDAAVLYAESAMNLRPWALWTKDGKAEEGTEEIVAVLEAVLRRNPDHTGANHYLIHAVEASPHPEWALSAADRLRKLAPKAGHLVHMPAHIYIRTGDYDAAALTSERAAIVDHAYFTRFNVTGIYPMMYYSHNLHFQAFAHSMQGRFGDAMKAGEQLVTHAAPHVETMPTLEALIATPVLLHVRFQHWKEIFALPAPHDKRTIVKSLWHYARGLAFVADGKIKDAEKELAAVQKIHEAMPEDLKYRRRNPAKKVLAIPIGLLQSKIAVALMDPASALGWLLTAVKNEDALHYAEPPDWYIPVREALGAQWLRMGASKEAEKVFRADLEKNRRNPRALFGLMESLKAQGNTHAAECVRQEFDAAWRNAEGLVLRVEGW